MTKPSVYHSQGYTCAEIIDFSYEALNEILDK